MTNVSELLKLARKKSDWTKSEECCGEVDSDGICCAPACSFGDAKLYAQLADIIEELQSDCKEMQERLIAYNKSMKG